MNESNVTFKGSVNGLTIIMNEDDDFKTILQEIEEKIDSSNNFFNGASINVKYKGKNLSLTEENEIYNLLTKKSGANIKSLLQDEEEHKIGIENINPLNDKMKMKTIFFKDIEEGITKFHRGTLRSGGLLKFNGNLVILGDVNPGAELVATGNIIVMGALRGIVHAGSDGNKDAIISALSLQPTQLRIGDIVTRCPDGGSKNIQLNPEIAYVKEGMVYIDTFIPQR